jgi:hypothetical protein
MKSRLVWEWICSIVIGTIFIYASIHKITDPCYFSSILNGYKLLPAAFINIATIILPFLECLFGIAIIIGIFRRGAALGIIITLLGFIAVLSFNLLRGLDFECGCFSSKGDLCVLFGDWLSTLLSLSSAHAKVQLRVLCDIVRDIVLLIPAITAFVLAARTPGKKN